MNVLFKRNMTAVKYHAHVLPQKSIWPMSHTSLTSGWRRQNSLSLLEISKIELFRRGGLPDDERCVQDQCRNNDGQNQTWHEAED